MVANEDTMLRTHCGGHKCFPVCPAGNICCGHKIRVRDTKMFLISFRNILRPQQMFPRLLAQENIMSNNVSATMCPRLPPPLCFCFHMITYFPACGHNLKTDCQNTLIDLVFNQVNVVFVLKTVSILKVCM